MTATKTNYQPYDETSLIAYLVAQPQVCERLGGAENNQSWQIEEVGDGNLNLVFIVRNAATGAGVVVKQALPYVRLVGESWPLPLSRAHFEYLSLTEQARHCPQRVPQVYHYDETQALIVMELLEPHIIMRKGMIAGVRYPHFVEHMSDFMASTLFFTSDLALSAEQKKQHIAEFCGNTALCKITEDLIFTDPYMIAENNRWTSPQLDADAQAIREDSELKVAISELKVKFLSATEALIHGDLHTGSIMITDTDTRVIDPEFGFYGPMGFDIGAVLANLLLNYFSQDGHATAADPREDYQEWVLGQITFLWDEFAAKFIELWNQQHNGDAYPQGLFADDRQALHLAQQRYMRQLLSDSLGFAGAKMIRRLLGLAHNIDLEWIEDTDLRARCERRGLKLGRELSVNRSSLADLNEVADLARDLRSEY